MAQFNRNPALSGCALPRIAVALRCRSVLWWIRGVSEPPPDERYGGIVDQIIQQLASGNITAEIIEITSPRGISYSVAVRRFDLEAVGPETLFTCRGADLHDLVAVLDAARTLTEHLLNGDAPEGWWDHIAWHARCPRPDGAIGRATEHSLGSPLR